MSRSEDKQTRPIYKKSLGQHHLRSGQLCRPLLDFLAGGGPVEERSPDERALAGPTLEGRRVVEIGPGAGVLTRELVRLGAEVTALEVDEEWAEVARREVPEAEVVVADALRYPWHELPAPTLVTGNLPFQVATPIVGDLLTAASAEPHRLSRIGVMVQKEVAERLVAGPGDEAYGALSVYVRATAGARWLGAVAAGSFRPPPKVDAAFVGLEPHLPRGLSEERAEDLGAGGRVAYLQRLREVVHQAFSHRRKTLRNSLGAGWGKKEASAALEQAGIDPRRRAETLDVEDFVALLEARSA